MREVSVNEDLKDLSVILVAGTDKLGQIISTITKSKYTHCAVYFEGKIYESAITLDRAFKVYNGVFENDQVKGIIFEYTGVIGDIQRTAIRSFIKKNYGKKYNIIKLLATLIIHPTKDFWNKIGWVPFSSITKGYICSQFVDRLFQSAYIDLLPKLHDDLSVPGDFAKSKYLRRVS